MVAPATASSETAAKSKALLIWTAGLLIFSVCWILWNRQSPGISDEHGPMENFQVICLAAGAVLLAYRFFVTGNRAERIFLSGLLCLFVTFLLLEADTRKTGLPSWLIKITNGRIRDLWLGGLWLVCGFFFMRHFKTVWDCFLAWLRRPAGKFMLVAGGFWIISAAIDKSTGATKSLFAEELMEVNATTLMLASAWLTARRQETQSASASASN